MENASNPFGGRHCEVEGCARSATCRVQDQLLLYGLLAFPVDGAPYGPPHYFCDLHERESHSYTRQNGRFVRC